MALMNWGDRQTAPRPGPVVVTHRGCGGGMDDHMLCTRCGSRLGPRHVIAEPGPGADATHPLRRRQAAPTSNTAQTG